MMIYTSYKFFAPKVVLLALVCLLASAHVPAFAQQTSPAQTPQPPRDDRQDDVLRVSTSIVQTDVSVVDKKGQFVEGLQRDEFEFKVDGKPQQCCSRARHGGRRGRRHASRGARRTAARGRRRGRCRTRAQRHFFVDDLHLSAGGILRARQLLLISLSGKMTPGTHVLIASASGSIGFLQQFTKSGRCCAPPPEGSRISRRRSLDNERPTMSAYLAMAIDRGDRDATAFMMRQMLSTENAVNCARAASAVRRATQQRGRHGSGKCRPPARTVLCRDPDAFLHFRGLPLRHSGSRHQL